MITGQQKGQCEGLPSCPRRRVQSIVARRFPVSIRRLRQLCLLREAGQDDIAQARKIGCPPTASEKLVDDVESLISMSLKSGALPTGRVECHSPVHRKCQAAHLAAHGVARPTARFVLVSEVYMRYGFSQRNQVFGGGEKKLAERPQRFAAGQA